ncbi:MAG: hypothetical protein KME67_05120 [Candidatus Thiodiazotropha sp. (ex Codakia orbicularis)]|nr:hypothetical protein [Candidatus Thiodiazotropha sp. (ex Codakia orbicularis)]
MKPTERSTGAQNKVIQLFPENNIRAEIQREQIRLANTYKRGKHPRRAVEEIANCLEANLAYLKCTGDIETAAQTEIEVIAYLRDLLN